MNPIVWFLLLFVREEHETYIDSVGYRTVTAYKTLFGRRYIAYFDRYLEHWNCRCALTYEHHL